MIDYLSLTLSLPPDKDYMEYHGEITEDSFRSQMYKYKCELDRGMVLFCPHKFKDSTNARMPFTDIILNPKYFSCYEEMEDYIFLILNASELDLGEINISRIDVAGDIEGVNVKAIIAMLHVKGIRNFKIIRNTIYAGSNPKVRIYDKLEKSAAKVPHMT